MACDATDDLGVLLFYDEHSNNFTYSVYLNREGFSFGYFFHPGGNSIDISKGILAFDYGNSIALISINKVHAARIECVSENSQQEKVVYEIDLGKPFAIAIPIVDSNTTIKIYDKNGNEIPITTMSC